MNPRADTDARMDCAVCHYDLSGHTLAGACPECGTSVRESARMWVALRAGVSGAGLNGLVVRMVLAALAWSTLYVCVGVQWALTFSSIAWRATNMGVALVYIMLVALVAHYLCLLAVTQEWRSIGGFSDASLPWYARRRRLGIGLLLIATGLILLAIYDHPVWFVPLAFVCRFLPMIGTAAIVYGVAKATAIESDRPQRFVALSIVTLGLWIATFVLALQATRGAALGFVPMTIGTITALSDLAVQIYAIVIAVRLWRSTRLKPRAEVTGA
ncbi:MAG: hypothetical protein SGJ11_09950 [Phycisphaerae bacterium]|mgnify:CR=1 FL=1|nr:hypothetical protein [Phycisphaerae bacterium]